MTPNRRERLVEGAFRWTRVRTRPGNYVKVFGWSRSVIADDQRATNAVLEAIRKFSEASQLAMFIGTGSAQRSIGSIQAQEFHAAVNEPNELDLMLGGTHIRSKGGAIGIVIDWIRSTTAPRTTILTTIQEQWFDASGRTDLLTACLGDVARSADHEYQIASHISDEVAKLAAPRPRPRYEGRPGGGIPYVPWWLVLGPAYVSAVGQEAFSRLGPEIVSWMDGFLSLRTSASPLLYGTAEAKSREAAIRDALGPLFLDSAGASSIRPDYPLEYTVGPPQTGEVWDAYARGGRVTVVPRKETKV